MPNNVRTAITAAEYTAHRNALLDTPVTGEPTMESAQGHAVGHQHAIDLYIFSTPEQIANLPAVDHTPLRINVPLFQRIMLAIAALPQRWNQGHFVKHTDGGCGTAFCVAGWALHLSGVDVVGFRNEHRRIFREAAALLGLTYREAAEIFFFTQTGLPLQEHPTFAQLKQRISAVTGIDFDSITAQAVADFRAAIETAEAPALCSA